MPGFFNIQYENGIVIKTINKSNIYANKLLQKLQNQDEFDNYKDIILNSYKLKWIGKHISTVIDVRRNGGYEMSFITGLNLMDILPKKHELCKKAGWESKELLLTKEQSIKILSGLINLEINLHKYDELYALYGDWFLHNLILDESDNIIKNIDLEGFYSYKKGSPMCDLKVHIPRQFNACKYEILKSLKSHFFSVILWNPVKQFYNDICKYIATNHVILYENTIKIENMDTFVQDVYEMDKRCYKPNLKFKIQHLEKYEQSVRILFILIDNPKYDKQQVSQTAVQLKENIRNIHKPLINNYYKDIIVHISDNSNEAESIYKKYFCSIIYE